VHVSALRRRRVHGIYGGEQAFRPFRASPGPSFTSRGGAGEGAGRSVCGALIVRREGGVPWRRVIPLAARLLPEGGAVRARAQVGPCAVP